MLLDTATTFNKKNVPWLLESELDVLNANWSVDTLMQAERNDRLGAFIVLSADKKHGWLITKECNNYNYPHAYPDVNTLVQGVIKESNGDLAEVSKILGVPVSDLANNTVDESDINTNGVGNFNDNKCYSFYLNYLFKDKCY